MGGLSAKDVTIPFNPSEGDEKSYEMTLTCNVPDFLDFTYVLENGISCAEKSDEGFKISNKQAKILSLRVNLDGQEISLGGDEIENFVNQYSSSSVANSFGEGTAAYVEEYQKKFKELAADTKTILDRNGNFVAYSNEKEITSAVIEYMHGMLGQVGANNDPSVAMVLSLIFNEEVLSDYINTLGKISYEDYGKKVPLKKKTGKVISFPLFIDGVNISFKGTQKVSLDKTKNYNIESEYKFNKADLIKFLDSAIEPVVRNFVIPVALATGEEVSDEEVGEVIGYLKSGIEMYVDEIPVFEIVAKSVSVLDGTTGLLNSNDLSFIVTFKDKNFAAYNGAGFTLKQISK